MNYITVPPNTYWLAPAHVSTSSYCIRKGLKKNRKNFRQGGTLCFEMCLHLLGPCCESVGQWLFWDCLNLRLILLQIAFLFSINSVNIVNIVCIVNIVKIVKILNILNIVKSCNIGKIQGEIWVIMKSPGKSQKISETSNCSPCKKTSWKDVKTKWCSS